MNTIWSQSWLQDQSNIYNSSLCSCCHFFIHIIGLSVRLCSLLFFCCIGKEAVRVYWHLAMRFPTATMLNTLFPRPSLSSEVGSAAVACTLTCQWVLPKWRHCQWQHRVASVPQVWWVCLTDLFSPYNYSSWLIRNNYYYYYYYYYYDYYFIIIITNRKLILCTSRQSILGYCRNTTCYFIK